MFDLVGDIHGHADQLIQLLELLGYEKRNGVYRHPERKLIFLGDFIDRGPRIREVLSIVRSMVEDQHALAIMGNHELNALAYHTADSQAVGEFLRRRTPNNQKQHSQTLLQLSPDELNSYLDWFRTLPMWLELDGLRAVHACWDPIAVELIRSRLSEVRLLDSMILHSACRPGNPLFDAVEVILKGKEALLPEGILLFDKEGHPRKNARVRWYLDPNGHTYRTYALSDDVHCDLDLHESVVNSAFPYHHEQKPVFVGHYWMTAKVPQILTHNVACLDFSVAKGGFLCAYRWNGEARLDNSNFVWTTS